MPYIKTENRPPMDAIVDLMAAIRVSPHEELGFILYRFCRDHISPSYNNYKNYIGEIILSCAEIERRLTYNGHVQQERRQFSCSSAAAWYTKHQ